MVVRPFLSQLSHYHVLDSSHENVEALEMFPLGLSPESSSSNTLLDPPGRALSPAKGATDLALLGHGVGPHLQCGQRSWVRSS